MRIARRASLYAAVVQGGATARELERAKYKTRRASDAANSLARLVSMSEEGAMSEMRRARLAFQVRRLRSAACAAVHVQELLDTLAWRSTHARGGCMRLRRAAMQLSARARTRASACVR